MQDGRAGRIYRFAFLRPTFPAVMYGGQAGVAAGYAVSLSVARYLKSFVDDIYHPTTVTHVTTMTITRALYASTV